MRTYRTDVDNEIIRTEDGNIYKHSDIIEHMTEKIDTRIGKIEKLKRETPTELEFADGKNRVLYGKADGTHEDLVKTLEDSYARGDVDATVEFVTDDLKKYYDDAYGKFGYTTNVRVGWSNVDALIEQGDMDGLATYLEGLKDRASLAPPTDQTLSDTALDKQATGLEIEVKRSLNKRRLPSLATLRRLRSPMRRSQGMSAIQSPTMTLEKRRPRISPVR